MKRFFAAIIVFVFCANSASALETSAGSAVLLDADSGRTLYEHNADERRLIASTTKIMTGYVALMNADPNAAVTIKRESTLVEGTRVYFKEGDTLTVRELAVGLLLQSGNDAALALADYVGGAGGVTAFVAMMNAAARELGMTGTSFANPHGLDAENHYSTARDMGKLARAAMAFAPFKEIVSMKTGDAGQTTVSNHNKMLKLYDGANGVKTGYTKAAGRCLVSGAERNGRQLIAVTLDDPSDWDDHAAMLDYGFEYYPVRTLCDADGFVCELPVVSGTADYVDVRVRDTVRRAFSEPELKYLRAEVRLPRFIWASVQAGETVGTIIFFSGNEVAGQSELYAGADVPEKETRRLSLWELVRDKLRGIL